MEFNLLKIIPIILMQMFTQIKLINPSSDLNENVYRFSQNNYNENSNLLSMNAILIECPDLVGNDDSKVDDNDSMCEDKIIATIRMKRNEKPCDSIGKVLLLDEVFNKKRKSKAKLMSPYLIQIRNGDPIVMYPLDFVDSVSCPNGNCSGGPTIQNLDVQTTSRDKKSNFGTNTNGKIVDYNQFFHDLDTETDKVQQNMVDYLKSDEFYDDVKNGHNARNVDPFASDRHTKNSDCYCGCPNCGDYPDYYHRCRCCSKCNRNPCGCRECIYVDDSLKCECCASLSSCHNGICSFNGEHFFCQNGLCHKSEEESICNSDPDMFNYKFKKLAPEQMSFDMQNYDSSKFDNSANQNMANLNFDSGNTEKSGFYRDMDYGSMSQNAYPLEHHQNFPKAIKDSGNENFGNSKPDHRFSFNYDVPASNSFNSVTNKKRNDQNEVYYDSEDDDENDLDDDFGISNHKYKDNYRGMIGDIQFGNGGSQDKNIDNEIEQHAAFRKRKILNPKKKQHTATKNNEIMFKLKKNKQQKNIKRDETYGNDEVPLAWRDSKIDTNPYFSNSEEVPYGEFLGDSSLDSSDKLRLINMLDNSKNMDDNLNRLLQANNDRTIVLPKPEKHCFQKNGQNKFFVRFRKNAKRPSSQNLKKLRKRSLDSYDENDNNFIDNIENEFYENYSTKFSKLKDLDEKDKRGAPTGDEESHAIAMNKRTGSHKKKPSKHGKQNHSIVRKTKDKNKPEKNKKPDEPDNDDDDDDDDEADDDIDELNEETSENTVNKDNNKIYNVVDMPSNHNDQATKQAKPEAKSQSKQNDAKEPENKESESKESDTIKRSVKNVWFSVFNMSAPLRFLTVKIHIFRKQNNLWRKIAQPMLLTSSSRIYANNNLSIIFSFHSDYVNLEKSLDPNRFKLLLPNSTSPNANHHSNTSNMTPDLVESTDFLTVDTNKIPIRGKESLQSYTSKLCEAHAAVQLLKNDDNLVQRRRREEELGMHILDDVSKVENFEEYSIEENCLNNSNKKCLNVLHKQMPAHKLVVKIPFIQNSVVEPDIHFVRITNIIIDGSSMELLGITVHLTNYGLQAASFKIIIAKCVPSAINGDNVKHKKLLPHIGLKACFKLPLQAILEYGVKEVTCEALVESSEGVIVSKRSFPARPQSRCFCIWNCACSCIGSFAMAEAVEKCHPIAADDYQSAGFGGAYLEQTEDDELFDWIGIVILLALFFFLLLLLGLIKALLGVCLRQIGKWRYDYLQPNQKFDVSSFGRRFFINSIFFLVFPCVCCCYCFEPKDEDELLINSSTTWQKTIIQNEVHCAINDDDDDDDDDPESDDELCKLLAESHKVCDPYVKRPVAESHSPPACLPTYNDEDEEKDTSFVLSALTESRESLKLIEGHVSEESTYSNPKFSEAVELVKKLLEAKIVYKIFNSPIGDVIIDENQMFSIRGYFLPSLGPGYDFITPSPLKQYWSITDGKNELNPINPPKVLNSTYFSANYKNKIDVIEKNDLVLTPSLSTPCINVLVQDANMYQI